MSHCQKILDALRDGQWHTTHDLYAELGGMILHSRISDLRKQGHNIEGRHVPHQTGAKGYEYRLLPSVTYIEVTRTRRPPALSPLGAAAEQLALTVAPQHYDI